MRQLLECNINDVGEMPRMHEVKKNAPLIKDTRMVQGHMLPNPGGYWSLQKKVAFIQTGLLMRPAFGAGKWLKWPIFIFHYSAAGCFHVNYIKSLIPEESVFLFPAFSVFTVRSTNFSSSTAELSEIHLDVAPDNLTESENLPLSPWH